MLRIENEALREEAHEASRRAKDYEFENQQLRSKCSQINSLYARIEAMQGSQTEVAELLKK